jgi:hypothetical protein
MGLTTQDVEAALDGADLVPAVQAGVTEAKQLLAELLDVGVPALIGRDDHCTKGCSPKLYVLVREGDLPRVAAFMQARQRAMLESAGVDVASLKLGIEAGEDENPPCPACGSTGALVEGACPECGLQLG